MVVAEEIQHFLGLGGLGKGGVAAQIAKHDDDLAAMAFEDLLVALRDDQLRQLRREEPLQSPDPTEFLDLLGDASFETTVQLRDLIGPLAQFTEQPCVLRRDDRLRREVFEESDLLVAEGSTFLTSDGDRADRHTLAEHRYRGATAQSGLYQARMGKFGVCGRVGDMHHLSSHNGTRRDATSAGWQRKRIA
jgi:hypothetical protein